MNWQAPHCYTASVSMFPLVLRLQALLDCPTYCGDYGSCVPGSGSSSVCSCDCGWTGGLRAVGTT